jgi:hypothetical protein
MRLKSFDNTPLEVYVILPPAPSSGTDGNYPLVVQSPGWGGSAGGANDTQYFGPTADAWAKNGYAVLQLTARGFGDSCGRKRPVEFLARGTAHWTLRLHIRIPPGRGYLVRSDAVDGFGHHQRHSTASVFRLRVS